MFYLLKCLTTKSEKQLSFEKKFFDLKKFIY